MKIKDLTGQTFGRLKVIKRDGSNSAKKATWLCQCKCGNTVIVVGYKLRRTDTQSCGCLRREKIKEGANTSHGFSRHGRRHSLYACWQSMKKRCTNPTDSGYINYGGRGIKVCDQWMQSFENFRDDMLPTWREKLELDRINNDGNYEPTNCKWSTRSENGKNRRVKAEQQSKYPFVSYIKRGNRWKFERSFSSKEEAEAFYLKIKDSL